MTTRGALAASCRRVLAILSEYSPEAASGLQEGGFGIRGFLQDDVLLLFKHDDVIPLAECGQSRLSGSQFVPIASGLAGEECVSSRSGVKPKVSFEIGVRYLAENAGGQMRIFGRCSLPG